MKWDWGLDGHNYSNYHNILSTHASGLEPVFCRYLEKDPFESILLHCNFLNFYAQLLLIQALCQFIDRRHFEARKFPTANWLNSLNFSQHNLATCKSQKNHFFFLSSFSTPLVNFWMYSSMTKTKTYRESSLSDRLCNWNGRSNLITHKT